MLIATVVAMVLMMGMGRAGGILAGIFLGCLKITALKYTFIFVWFKFREYNLN